jgi:hypothetical protein
MTMTTREPATHTRSGGWVARREATVRVLTDLAGLSSLDLTGLTADDVTVLDGTATIRTPTRTVTVPAAADGMCGPCTLARWLHTLDLTVLHTDPLVVTAVITRAAAPTPHQAEDCRATATIGPDTRRLPLLPQVDPWGPLPIHRNTRSVPGGYTHSLPDDLTSAPASIPPTPYGCSPPSKPWTWPRC